MKAAVILMGLLAVVAILNFIFHKLASRVERDWVNEMDKETEYVE